MNSDIKLKGLAILYYPVVWLWNVLFFVITPRFWYGVIDLAEGPMPLPLRIIVVFFVSIIVLCVYLAVFGVFMIAIISLAILTSVVYAFGALINVIGGWWKYWTISISNLNSLKSLLNNNFI